MKFWTAAASSLTIVPWFLGVARAVPSGFSNKEIIEKTSFMTDIAFTSEDMGHLMFVTQKAGLIHVYEPGENYEYKDKIEALDIEATVCFENERGLGGLQLHPDFDMNNIVYTYYTFPKYGNCYEDDEIGPVNRLSKWIFQPKTKTIDPDSEVVLLDTPPLKEAYHNGGKIEFGKDGYLYVTIGDGGPLSNSERLDNVFGGIVRLTDTGNIPPDNPFVHDTSAVRCNENGHAESEQKCLELYAIGLRNPWRFSMDPNTESNKVRFFVNDVGFKDWEEVSEGGDDFGAAAISDGELGILNYGWPEFEGPCKRGSRDDCQYNKTYIFPVHFYQHQGGGAATAGVFIPNGFWPEEYDNMYFFADYIFGNIYFFGNEDVTDCAKCSPPASKKDPQVFLSHNRVMTMRFGPYIGGNMALYYTSSDRWGVMHQVVCDKCVATDSSGQTDLPMAAPTLPPVVVQPSRPDGKGGYPGVLFPWYSGSDCPEGYDYCGMLEFCMQEHSLETGTTYGYRMPCNEMSIYNEEQFCECKAVPGPLIRVIPGNKYKITLRNAGTEVTNLHTHGLHIVGDGDGDDVTREVMGGGNCLDYTWEIAADHPGGTNWYHAHHHGISEKQVGGGAYGMLIVEDNINLDPILPAWAGNEHLLQVAIAVGRDEILANGRKTEIIDMAAKQWYRLRVSLADANGLPYNFTFDDNGMCDIHKVAQDGVWRSVVPGPQSSVWELTGSSRADFAIRCNTTEALVPIYYRENELVAQIWVGSEEHNPQTMEEFIPNRPYSISNMLSERVPEGNRFSVRLGFNYVNEKRWSPVEPIATIAYNQVHEWTLMQTWYHPFHMHLYHMQIATPGGCGPHEEGEFYDTISAPGNCTIRFRTADIGQRCVLHCHVLHHEDSGSMSWVNVTGENMPMNTKQSFEYECPASTLSVKSCLPGFLGITADTPLLDGEEFINKEYGVYIRQQGDGNLVVRRGTPTNRGEVVWAHGVTGNSTRCFTKLSKDSNLATLTGTPGNEGKVMWETGIVNQDGSYFLGIDCKSEIVSIYAGDPNGRSSAVSVWNSVPTPTPTSSPSQSPTERCIPGFLGISTGMPLLDNGSFINEEYGVYIKQQGDGNLVIRRGTPEKRGEVVWAHGVLGNSTSSGYFSQLKRNSNLLTLEGTPNDGRSSDRHILWRSEMINPLGDYFLGIDCTHEIISIYAGNVFTMDDLSAALPIWNLTAPRDDSVTHHLRSGNGSN